MFERFTIWLVGWIGSLFLRLLYATLRVEWRSERRGDEMGQVVFAFWHGRQLLMPWIRRSMRFPVRVLISAHRDGRMISETVRHLGLVTVAGSSTRGGRSAMLEFERKIADGVSAAFTPDGPKGPACKVKPGVVRLAQVSGVPVLPVAFGAERAWRFKSWDRMVLPKPFSRCAFAVGEPIRIPKELSDDEFKRYCDVVEAQINAVTALVDRF